MADASFQKEFQETHNAYRAKHGAPQMTFNSEMCASAQKWADHLLSIGGMKHSETKDGENIYYMSSSAGSNPTGKEAVDSWYRHFTQVVWKESSELGVGVATDGKTVFVVGHYRPAGNKTNPGYLEANVLQAGREEGGAGSPSSGGASPKKTCTLL
ncbi:hypothetical protein JOQ06_012223 [Pogonophryne albipinna]|uniref:SCP domain-containing protein n=1 Tax=Pogonophryne albipinna TaxID=1090488 RepID=A0AAD6BEB0_9TELE|nr:hypothetical protein JOQ06_012223 [Pogonophryne albipinna]